MDSSIAEANDQVYQTNVKLAAFRTIVFPLLGLMTGFSYLVVLFYGGKLAMEDAITIGDLMAFSLDHVCVERLGTDDDVLLIVMVTG